MMPRRCTFCGHFGLGCMMGGSCSRCGEIEPRPHNTFFAVGGDQPHFYSAEMRFPFQRVPAVHALNRLRLATMRQLNPGNEQAVSELDFLHEAAATMQGKRVRVTLAIQVLDDTAEKETNDVG